MRTGGRAWGMAFAAAIALLLTLAPAASARLRGELDPSFGDGGKVLLGFGPTLANSGYTAIARQPGGSLVLSGHTESVQGKYVEGAVFVQRRLPDGGLERLGTLEGQTAKNSSCCASASRLGQEGAPATA